MILLEERLGGKETHVCPPFFCIKKVPHHHIIHSWAHHLEIQVQQNLPLTSLRCLAEPPNQVCRALSAPPTQTRAILTARCDCAVANHRTDPTGSAIMATILDIKLNRFDRVYRAGVR